MNIYKLNMSYDDEGMEDGIGWDCEVLTHENKYTSEEFREICNMARIKSREEYGEVLLYNVTEVLVKDFGFKEIEFAASFDFHEEY